MFGKNGSPRQSTYFIPRSVVRHARVDPLIRAGPCSRKRYADVGMNTARPCGLVVSKRKLILIYEEKRKKKVGWGKGPPRDDNASLAGVTGKEEEQGEGAADKNI